MWHIPIRNDGSFSICQPRLIYYIQKACDFKDCSYFLHMYPKWTMKKITLGNCWVFIHNSMCIYRLTYRKQQIYKWRATIFIMLQVHSASSKMLKLQITFLDTALLYFCCSQDSLRHIKINSFDKQVSWW